MFGKLKSLLCETCVFSIFNWRLSGIKLIVENYSKFIISKLKSK